MTLVATVAGLRELRGVLQAEVAAGRALGFDTEWDAPGIIHRGKRRADGLRADIVGWSVAVRGRSEGWYVPRRSDGWVPPEGFAAEEAALLRFVTVPKARVVAHNWKGELHALRNAGYEVRCRLLDSEILAWLVGWRLPGKGGLKLKALAAAHLGVRRPTFEDIANGRQASAVPLAELAPYAAADAVDTLSLWTKARERAMELDLGAEWALNEATIPVAAEMESAGFALDSEGLLADAAACGAELAALEERFEALTRTTVALPTKVRQPKPCPGCVVGGSHDGSCRVPGCVSGVLHFKNGKPRMESVVRDVPTLAGAHPGNDAQVARWLYRELRWWPVETTRGQSWPDLGEFKIPTTAHGHSVAEEDIRRFTALPGPAGEAARLRLRYQALRKYSTTYTTALTNLAAQSGDGRLHSTFRQDGTPTSRFSSSAPNLQNLPSSERQDLPWLGGLPDIRARFVARPGWTLVVRDFSQIELRLVAHYSRDRALLQAYHDGLDLHAMTVERVGGGIQRRHAKIVNFSTIYRITAPRLATKLSMATNDWGITPATAQGYIDGFFQAYPGVVEMHAEFIDAARRNGYAETLTGFKRPLTEWTGRRRWGTENQAINTPIQGSAGGIMKRAQAKLYEVWVERGWLVPGDPGASVVRILSQVHDELIVECRADLAHAVNRDMEVAMETAAPELRVPLTSSGGIGPTWAAAKD